MTGEPTHTVSKQMTPYAQQKEMVPCALIFIWVSIVLCYQLYLTHYREEQIKNYSKSTFAITVATIKKYRWFLFWKGASHHVQPLNWYLSAKMTETQRRTLKNALYVLRYAKGTYLMLKEWKINSIPLATVEYASLKASGRQAVIQ